LWLYFCDSVENIKLENPHFRSVPFLTLQVQYLERAEKLKQYLNGKKKKPVKAGEAGSTDSKKPGGDKVKLQYVLNES
jgi:hypothetical protein